MILPVYKIHQSGLTNDIYILSIFLAEFEVPH